MGVTIMGFAEHSGPGLNPVTNNSKFLFSFISLHFWSCSVYFALINSIKSVHTCIMKNLSKNWWVPGGLEPGIMDPKSGMFAPRPILEKAINFWSGLLKFKFEEFFTKKYYNNLHEVHKKNQKKIVIKLSALLIHSCWNCSNKYWGGCYDNRALRIIGLSWFTFIFNIGSMVSQLNQCLLSQKVCYFVQERHFSHSGES